MEILFVCVKGRGKKPHVWGLPTPAKMYPMCPTLGTQEWQRQHNQLLEPQTPKMVKLHQIHSAGARKLQNYQNRLSCKRNLLGDS